MANTMRWRYGDTNPVLLPVDSATVIEIGDLVYLETDDARPAGSEADQGSESANQQLFHTKFAGVAMQSSPDGESDSIRVATTGVFEFDCAAATFEVGDLIGAVEATSGTALEDQAVAGVADAGSALGRCAKRVNPAGTRVLVDIVSTITRGGPQEAA
jgi:hypothetical protein